PFLRKQLGWFGELALAPAPPLKEDVLATAAGAPIAAGLANNRAEIMTPAVEMFLKGTFGLCLILFLGLVGLVSLVIFLALAGSGRIWSKLACGAGRGRVYAETFALWLLLWLGLSLLAAASGVGFAASGAASLLSLLALAWPVQRGIP